MRGADVIVEYKTQTGRDAHGNTVETTSTETVHGVLCMPGVTKDDVDLVRANGVKVDATLAFPKGYTRRLRGCRVYITPWRRWFRVIGDPLPVPHNCPTPWDYKVWTEAEDG